MNEAGAVRGAILRSLESGAQRHIEDALDPRDAWITLEKQYLTSGNDAQLVTMEQQLADLKLEDGGDVVEHIANFCRLRRHLNETRFELDEQSSIDMLYRSLPPSYRHSILTPERSEMKDFNMLCARLRELHQTPIIDTSDPEDHSCWGVPEDIKAFGMTGDKNPLLEERAAITCQDCLLKDHEAGTPACPQYEWRRELWGTVPNRTGGSVYSSPDGPVAVNMKRLSYEFSEPVKVALNFDEIGLRHEMKDKLRRYCPMPSAIQQCAILPIINGRNAFIQAPHNNGKTTALVISVLHMIKTSVPLIQALVFTPTEQAATSVHQIFQKLKWDSGPNCFLYNPSKAVGEADLGTLIEGSHYQIAIGTPAHLLGLVLRNILKTHHLKIFALDDLDKLIEAGSDKQILEVYQHTPPLAQTIASCTVSTLPMSAAVKKLLLDPIRISVNRDEGILMRAPHFFVKVPEDQKPVVLQASFASLSVEKVFILCHDTEKIAGNNWSGGFYYMKESMEAYKCEQVLRQFKEHYRNRTALATTNGILSKAGLLNYNIPLINYDVPKRVTILSYLTRSIEEVSLAMLKITPNESTIGEMRIRVIAIQL
ncbi:unnamed protein product [Rhizoctonia solani]|uniref:RNA helicase n=1 Tax=Rhizoctonia solani TaxID=456999 RepID=A0A8H3I0P2_9AGAM|nr:unnamed protein product [Rhizoctonia solani]